jgi:cobalt-zinc-cadmium efflux system membrane fusion protein
VSSGSIRVAGFRLERTIVAALLFAAMASAQCAGGDRDRDAETADEHHETGEHDHAHEETESLGSVTMLPEALAAHGVEIRRAGPGLVRMEIDLPGEIVLNADRVAHIVPRFPGIVQKVNSSLGDRVRAGEVLAVIQSNVSAAPYDVTTMLDGSIIEKHVTLGEYVRDDADIFVVADLSTVWVSISVYARFLADVKPGQKVRITSPGVGESTEGAIDYVGPLVGERTRTGRARMILPNPKQTWQPGLFVTAHITVAETRAPVAVPDEAIQTVEGREAVFVRSGNTFSARPVTTGRRGGDLVEIVGGLAAGEDYAAAGSFILKAEFGKSEAAHEH